MDWTLCFLIVLCILLFVDWMCTRNHIDDVENRLDRRLLELETYVDGLDDLNRHRLNNLEPLVMRLKKELEDMTNLEKYFWVVNDDHNRPMCILCKIRGEKCSHYTYCKDCERETLKWLNKEYEEPKKHYTEIEVKNGDCLTPGQEVLVNDYNCSLWQTRTFLAYYDCKFYCLDEMGHTFAYDRCKIVKEV